MQNGLFTRGAGTVLADSLTEPAFKGISIIQCGPPPRKRPPSFCTLHSSFFTRRGLTAPPGRVWRIFCAPSRRL